MKEFRIISMWEIDNPLAASDYPEFKFHYCGVVDGSYWSALRYALGVFLSGKHWDLLFAGGLRVPLAFAFLNRIFFWRKIPIYVGASVFLEVPSPNPFRRAFQEMKAGLLRNGVERMMVLSTEEIESYQKTWRIPADKMELILFKVIDEDGLENLPKAEEPFLYTGGNSERDYTVFFEAVKDLDLQVKVLSTLDFSPYNVPANVEIIPNDGSTEAFYGPMARSRLTVIPLVGGRLRSSGQGTYLSAMFMGKCLILSGVAGVKDLVENGVTGVVVPPGDSGALRDAINRMLADPERAREIGRQAREVVKARNTHGQYMRIQLARIAEICRAQSKGE